MPGAPCCPGSRCDADDAYFYGSYDQTTCNADSVCETTCGRPGLPCCPDNSGEPRGCQGLDVGLGIPRSACLSGVCEPCGQLDQPCCGTVEGTVSRRCDGDVPGSQLLCDNAANTCTAAACGGVNQTCCIPDDPSYLQDCVVLSSCDTETDTCTACGYEGEDCCVDPDPRNTFRCTATYPNGEAYSVCSDENVCTVSLPRPPLPPPPPPPPPGAPASSPEQYGKNYSGL